MKKYLVFWLITSLIFPYIALAYDLSTKDLALIEWVTVKIEKIIEKRWNSIRNRIISLLQGGLKQYANNPRMVAILEKTIENISSDQISLSSLYGQENINNQTPENTTISGVDTAYPWCNYEDIKIGDQIWAGCNVIKNAQDTYENEDENASDSNGNKYWWLFDYYHAIKACEKGYHLPSRDDWIKACKSTTKTDCSSDIITDINLRSILKLPLSGEFNQMQWYVWRGMARYWGATEIFDPNTKWSRGYYILYISSENLHLDSTPGKLGKYSVRCIKN